MKYIDSILTAALGPEDAILQWLPFVGSAFVYSPIATNQADGVVYIPSEETTLREVLLSHLGRIRGREVVGLAQPDIHLRDGLDKLLSTLAVPAPMELSWAFYFRTPKGPTPRLFLLNTAILPHILLDLPETVLFTNGEWRHWLHDWCSTHMQVHRYVDGTGYSIIEDAVLPQSYAPTSPDPVQEAISYPPEQENPVKAKRGRKKKAHA